MKWKSTVSQLLESRYVGAHGQTEEVSEQCQRIVETRNLIEVAPINITDLCPTFDNISVFRRGPENGYQYLGAGCRLKIWRSLVMNEWGWWKNICY